MCHCYLSSSCLVAHRAFTERLHSTLSAAATLVSFHDRQQASARSLSTVRRHVVFGRPRFLRPSGAHVNAMLQSLVKSCLSVCPMNFHLLLLTSSIIGLIFVLIKRSSFLTRSSHFMFMIFLSHLFWKYGVCVMLYKHNTHQCSFHRWDTSDLMLNLNVGNVQERITLITVSYDVGYVKTLITLRWLVPLVQFSKKK